MSAFAATRKEATKTITSHFGSFFGSNLTRSNLSPPFTNRINTHHFSKLVQSHKNGNRVFLVDTLALVRKLEAEGVPSKQAESITSCITQVLNDTLENVADSFVSKAEMEKIVMTQDAHLSKFKSEVNSSQGHHFSMLQHETEKLKGDIEKMRSELKYEIDKVTAGQRLDLNLERGRIRDELANQVQETSNLTNTLDREIHALRAQVEAAKFDIIKYCIVIQKIENVEDKMPGWQSDISSVRNYSDLPKAARDYVERIEELVSVPVHYIGIGPGRDALIYK